MTGQCTAALDCTRPPDGTGLCWHHRIDDKLASKPGPDDHRLPKADLRPGLGYSGAGLSWSRIWSDAG